MKIKEILVTSKVYSQRFHVTADEKIDETRVCDPSGYVPIKDRIESFMRAGENLEKWREQIYDYDEDFEHDFTDEELDLSQKKFKTMGADITEIYREYEDSLYNLRQQTIPERREKSWHSTETTTEKTGQEENSSGKTGQEQGRTTTAKNSGPVTQNVTDDVPFQE